MINFIPLVEPIEAQKLKFSVNGKVANYVTNAACLTVAVFGCLSSEGKKVDILPSLIIYVYLSQSRIH